MIADAHGPFNEEIGQAVAVDITHGEQAAVGLVDRPNRIEMAGSVVLVEDELTPAAVYGLRAKHDLLSVIVVGIANQHIRPKVVLMIESLDDLKALLLAQIIRSTRGKRERTKHRLTLWRSNRGRIGLRESGCGSEQNDNRNPNFHNTLLLRFGVLMGPFINYY